MPGALGATFGTWAGWQTAASVPSDAAMVGTGIGLLAFVVLLLVARRAPKVATGALRPR